MYDERELVPYYQKLAEDPKQDALKNPRHPRELLLENFFIPFMAQVIKDLKCEEMRYMMSPELDALVQTFKLPKNSNNDFEFNRMNPEQYMAFKHAFVEERMYNPIFKANKGYKAMDLILNAICMILCGKLPKNVVSFGTSNLASKIKLVRAPPGIETVSRIQIEKVAPTPENPKGEQEVTIEKNTNEKAVVRILVPKRTMTLSELNAEENKREEEGKVAEESPEKKADEAGDGEKTGEKTATEPDANAEEGKVHEGALPTEPEARSQ